MKLPFSQDPARPFQLVKFLSWSSLILIIGSSIFIVFLIGNYAKSTIVQKDKEFANLLAENLNHQIYRRFTLPTVLGFGRVELKNKAQYKRLDQTVHSTIHGFKVLGLRIYDLEGEVTYALDNELIGRKNLAGKAFKIGKKGEPSYEIVKKELPAWSFFKLRLPEGSYILRTTFPLRTERSLAPQHKGTLVGILQFTQDITPDYETITYFQLIITLIVLISSLIMFLLLYMIILRADKFLAERFREKERLERKLLQNEKLASMGRMLASIAHEIRNPLGIIQSSAELLHKRFSTAKDPTEKLAKAIFDESKRLSKIVNDFLDFARPKSPKLLELNLSQVLDQAINFLGPELNKKGVQVKGNYPEVILIKGDFDMLYRAVYNILANACQAIEGSGKIYISWQEDGQCLKIEDTGPGFNPELQDKYLEPFYTSKDYGTGLGLSIVNNILHNHAASLELSSTTNGGLVTICFDSAK